MSVSDYKEEAMTKKLRKEGPVLEVRDLGRCNQKALSAAFFNTGNFF